MAFKRLVGDDGALFKAALGTMVSGNGTLEITRGSWIKIASKAASGSLFGQLTVGDYYFAPVDITPIANDNWYPMTLTQLADVTGASLNVSADEVDVTVLKDRFKKYRKGKQDSSGTLKFNFIQDITDIAGGIGNSFYRICAVAADGTAVVTEVDDDPILLVLYLDVDVNTDGSIGSVAGDVVNALVAEVELYNFDLPLEMSTATSTESSMRLSGATDPMIYRITMGAVA